MKIEIITSIKPKTNLNWVLEAELGDQYYVDDFNFKENVEYLEKDILDRIKEALKDNIDKLELKDFSLKFEQY